MATPITDSNSIQLGLQNDESNLIQATVLPCDKPSTFSPGCARLTLLYIYIYTAEILAERLLTRSKNWRKDGRSVSERSDGLDGLIPAWRLNYCASRGGGWMLG